jgi:coatomer subunit beta'
MSIKLWDWEKNWENTMTFEGHSHYVMMVKINPRDTNTFASGSLDRTIKVWGLTAGTPHFSLEGPGSHERGVNCIDYYPGGDKPYLLSGADDRTVKIWDYQTKACLQTLDGHSHNVSSVCFHPRLPLIISASEDGTVRLWHSTTYRPETTLNYGMERAWALAPTKDANKLAIGYDEGTVVIKLGNEKPVASLDTNSGKVVWAQAHDIQTISLKGVNKDGDIVDGERINVSPKDMGACEVYPQNLLHNSSGNFIVVCGDGEYIIYTSQALRNKAFGSALDFVWSAVGSGDYAIRESISRVKTFKNFKEHKQIQLPISSAEGIFGGVCLAVRGPDCVVFFDWHDGEFIRKIDVVPQQIFWNESGDAVVLACADCYYILRYDAAVVSEAIGQGNINPDEGVNGSFELETTIQDRVRTGQWVGDCFLYTNGAGKLEYYVGGEVMTLCHLNHHMYLLGFVPKEDRVFLIDKTYNIVSYKLLLCVLNYQTAVVRKDFEVANSILPSIPKSELAAVAKFLESQGFKEEALAVSTDPDHRFELSLDLKKLDVAHNVLLTGCVDDDSTESMSRWRRLGDLALSQGEVALAQLCASKSGDLSGLLLLYSSSGDKQGMFALAKQAVDAGRTNVAFLAYFVTGHVEECVQLLISTNRIPEAAFFARTYMPSKIIP